ncbi:MAG: hypothetical protein NC318_13110 [Blautia sp.]|nr:hypothetical protein [Lachnoclostridium sp.]MCM1212528.1 hypothetical protein [Blautia sp.]
MKKQKIYDILRFALKCILIPAAAVLVIYCLNKPYRRINAQKYLDVSKFDTLKSVYEEVQIGNIGSSHGAYNFDYSALTALGYSCFNFANASQSYNYDYAILKEYGHYMTPGSVLFIPVSYFSFNNEVVNDTEAQAMSLRYYHCLSPENIPDYDFYVDIITNKLPILSAGEEILKLLPDFKLSMIALAAEEETSENVPANEDTDTAADDAPATESIDIAAFAERAKARYSRHFDNKEEYFMPERIEELRAIIDYCKEREITPVLITTPFSKYYYELVSQDFLEEFHDTIDTIISDTGVNYYDYSCDARFQEHLEYFSDCDHLNDKGAAYFMDLLMEEVEELSALSFHTTVSMM